MTWQFHYTPAIWPMLASAVFMAALAVFGWRRRHMPGARPFAVLAGFFSARALCVTLLVAATGEADKVVWLRGLTLSAVAVAVPSLCFALEFAGLGRWVTRRNVILLSIVPVLSALLIITNEAHHLFYGEVWYDGFVRFNTGPLYPIVTAYAYVLPLLNTAILVWLFVRSSGIYRLQAGLVLFGGLVPRAGMILNILNVNPLAPLDPGVLTGDVMAICYAIALFRFRMFEIRPVARSTLLGLMREGMLVLDTQDRVVELNQAAERLLSLRQLTCLGQPAAEVLVNFPGLATVLGQPGKVHAEVPLTVRDAPPRCFEVFVSSLALDSGRALGRLILLYDITETRQAREQLMEQQAVVVALREREQMARELHDGLSQNLGYIKMQVEATRTLLAQERKAEAASHLERLAAVAQDVHADVRDYIYEASADSPIEIGFGPSVERCVQRFSQNHQIHTELRIPPELADGRLDPAVSVQLLRIIQEALTNVRKHAHASRVLVSLVACDGTAEVSIIDDGKGFDPERVESGGFGLRFVRERAREVGGNLQVRSAPGQGTEVLVRVPLNGR